MAYRLAKRAEADLEDIAYYTAKEKRQPRNRQACHRVHHGPISPAWGQSLRRPSSSARCGPCAAPPSRNNGRAGEGIPIAVTEAGRGEACRYGRRFAAAGMAGDSPRSPFPSRVQAGRSGDRVGFRL